MALTINAVKPVSIERPQLLEDSLSEGSNAVKPVSIESETLDEFYQRDKIMQLNQLVLKAEMISI